MDLSSLKQRAPWLIRDVLWASQGVVLTVVSAYYSTRWALHHGFPPAMAFAVFVALELSALLGLVVMAHPADSAALKRAVRLVLGSALAAALVNGLMHALDLKLIGVTPAGVLLTGAVVPVMLAWSSHVARGMRSRPKRDLSGVLVSDTGLTSDTRLIPDTSLPVQESLSEFSSLVDDAVPTPVAVVSPPIVRLVPSPTEVSSSGPVADVPTDEALSEALRAEWIERARRPGEYRMSQQLGVSRVRIRRLLDALPDPLANSNNRQSVH